MEVADGLTDEQVTQFVEEGVVAVEGAFPRAAADAAREILWTPPATSTCATRSWSTPPSRTEATAPGSSRNHPYTPPTRCT